MHYEQNRSMDAFYEPVLDFSTLRESKPKLSIELLQGIEEFKY